MWPGSMVFDSSLMACRRDSSRAFLAGELKGNVTPLSESASPGVRPEADRNRRPHLVEVDTESLEQAAIAFPAVDRLLQPGTSCAQVGQHSGRRRMLDRRYTGKQMLDSHLVGRFLRQADRMMDHSPCVLSKPFEHGATSRRPCDASGARSAWLHPAHRRSAARTIPRLGPD